MKKIIAVVCCLGLAFMHTHAQSLQGKVIYVTRLEEVMLRFKSVVIDHHFTNKDEGALFEVKVTNDKNISINSKVDGFTPKRLVVYEGNNVHTFVVEYKEQVVETVYDFSSKKQLKAEAQKLEEQKAAASKPPPVIVTGPVAGPQTSTPVNTPVNAPGNQPTSQQVNQPTTQSTTSVNTPPKQPVTTPSGGTTHVPVPKPRINEDSIREAKKLRDEAKKQQDIQNKFNDTVALADGLFKTGSYDVAKKKYAVANKIKPGETYVVKRMAEIDSISTARKAAMKKADDEKRLALENEKKMQADEKARIAAVDKQYNNAIKQGKTAFDAGKYESARKFYSDAAQLKPAEKLPATQLNAIEARFAEIRINEQYDWLMHLADSAVGMARDYHLALKLYDSAWRLKPKETRPGKQIASVNQQLLDADMMNRRLLRSEKFKESLVYFRKGDNLRLDRKYGEAYTAFSTFLSNVDTLNINEYMSSERVYIDQAKYYLTRLESYKPVPKVVEPIAPPPPDTRKKKKKGKGN